MAKSIISQEAAIAALIRYDADTGNLHWTRKYYGAVEGDVAGNIDHSNGYLRLRIKGVAYYAHRVAWLLTNNCWPAHQLDHIDGNRLNNRLCNLREATDAQNRQNIRAPRKDSTHGYLGVSREGGRWSASIRTNGRKQYLGTFDTPEEARDVYLRAKRERHAYCTI